MSVLRRRLLVLVLAGALLGGAALLLGRAGLLPSGRADGPVTVTIASSVTKENWLNAAKAAFEASDPKLPDGRPIRIEITQVLSGESLLQISEGRLTPTVWSPGEITWMEQLQDRWSQGHDSPIATEACAPTVLTPVGIAMWRPMAEAMGWPDTPFRLKALVDLANDPQGWARYGHPEWGRLRLGHTHPQYSNAGLLFMASLVYAITGKTAGITAADISAPEVEAALRALAQNTAKYGMITTDLLASMADQGPDFLHATSAFEEGTVRFNLERGADLDWPLVFLFPEEGTFWANHPYCLLDGSGWVTKDEAAAARIFLDHLLSPEVQALAGPNFIRPLSADVPLGERLSQANGTDPTAVPKAQRLLEIPSPDISAALIDLFLRTKRQATAILLLDVSASMKGEKIEAARAATSAFIRRFAPGDRLGLMTFSSDLQVLARPADLSQSGQTLQDLLARLQAGGEAEMTTAVCRAAEMLETERQADLAEGENRLYGIILLSDGKHSGSGVSVENMYATCLTPADGTPGPKVFVIGFGADADRAALQRLAEETRGGYFAAEPGSIGEAYLRISAEQ